MQQNEVLFTAIVAAYNVEKYIVECMNSLLKISNDDLEIIIVIGRETDRTNDICKTYADSKKIKVIQQNGTGLSNARNCGIDAASGKYILFIDGDDSVRPKELELFLDASKKLIANRMTDVILNDFYFTTEDGKTLVESVQIEAEKKQFRSNLYIGEVLAARGTFWNAWRFLFSKDYLKEKKLQFKENSMSEDLEFAVRIMMDTDRIWFCHMPYYNYCPIRSDSLSNRMTSKAIEDLLTIQIQLREILKDSDIWYAALILKKLDELMILNLPDIFEVNRSERRMIVDKYKTFFKQEGISAKLIYTLIFGVCRTDGIYLVSILLYYLKKLRRKLRYKV